MSTIRILCLHGHHGSAAVLRRQIAPVAASLPAGVELVFIDAPSLASGDFGWWHEGFRGWERTRFTRKLRVPSLHVIGRADGIVPMRERRVVGDDMPAGMLGDHRVREALGQHQ
jgi:Serine hydrolase (FSH1)